MTASIVPVTRTGRAGGVSAALPGLRPLVRKDFGEWLHGKRAWVVLVVTTLFMTLTAANNAITSWLRANVSAGDGEIPQGPMSLVPVDNLLAGASSQIFVLAAIFAAMSLIVAERESGALAWIASKPVSRASIWVSKWVSASVVLGLVAGLVPLAITTGLVTVLYGMPSVAAVAVLAFGIVAAVALFVAIALTASTFVGSQPAVAGIGFGAFVLPSMLGAVVPFEIAPYLPTSIVAWSVGAASGAEVGFVTPIAWAVGTAVLAGLAIRRMGRLEL